MKTQTDKSESTNNSSVLIIAVAWMATLLISSLGDILWFKLAGEVPLWLLFAKISLLGGLILLSWLWKPIRALNHFFIILLAITSLLKADTWLLGSNGWMAWQNHQSFSVVTLTAQLVEIGVAIIIIGILILLRKNRKRIFLVIGDINAKVEPVKWINQKSPGPLWRFGLIFTIVVIVAQIFMFIIPLPSASEILRHLLPKIPIILLLAAANGFSEEIILRVAPISTVYEVVGKSNAIWMAAILFGLSHYIGGIPSGVPGVLTTTFLGWFFGKCLLDSRGFFWPWFFHSLQDILPFTMMFLAAVS
jgi:uncharacterized protein